MAGYPLLTPDSLISADAQKQFDDAVNSLGLPGDVARAQDAAAQAEARFTSFVNGLGTPSQAVAARQQAPDTSQDITAGSGSAYSPSGSSSAPFGPPSAAPTLSDQTSQPSALDQFSSYVQGLGLPSAAQQAKDTIDNGVQSVGNLAGQASQDLTNAGQSLGLVQPQQAPSSVQPLDVTSTNPALSQPMPSAPQDLSLLPQSQNAPTFDAHAPVDVHDETPPSPSLPMQALALAQEPQRLRQTVDLGLPNPGQPQDMSPGQKLDYYLNQTNPSQPLNVRIGQALDLAEADQRKGISWSAQNADPTKGLISGVASTATDLMTDPTMVLGGGLGKIPAIASVAGGLLGGGVSLATGQNPAQTASNIETGANLGMIGGAVGEGLVHVAPKVIEALSSLPERARQAALSALSQEPGVTASLAAPADSLSRADLGGIGPSAAEQSGAVTRMYHGTGSAFQSPDAAKFDPNGLFGPGYYVTSDARVASSYAQPKGQQLLQATRLQQEIDELKTLTTRQAWQYPAGQVDIWKNETIPRLQAQLDELQVHGPNVRAVSVPNGLKLLDADAPIGTKGLSDIQAAAQAQGVRSLQSPKFAALTPITAGSNGEQLYGRLTSAIATDLGTEDAASRAVANQILAQAGYDGITYQGGKRIPLMDAAGQPIEHTAVVVFPESMPKLRNAISGTPGGLRAPEVTPTSPFTGYAGAALQGAVSGGIAGGQQASQQQNANPLSIAGGALQGAGLGLAQSVTLRALRNHGVSPSVLAMIGDRGRAYQFGIPGVAGEGAQAIDRTGPHALDQGALDQMMPIPEGRYTGTYNASVLRSDIAQAAEDLQQSVASGVSQLNPAIKPDLAREQQLWQMVLSGEFGDRMPNGDLVVAPDRVWELRRDLVQQHAVNTAGDLSYGNYRYPTPTSRTVPPDRFQTTYSAIERTGSTGASAGFYVQADGRTYDGPYPTADAAWAVAAHEAKRTGGVVGPSPFSEPRLTYAQDKSYAMGKEVPLPVPAEYNSLRGGAHVGAETSVPNGQFGASPPTRAAYPQAAESGLQSRLFEKAGQGYNAGAASPLESARNAWSTLDAISTKIGEPQDFLGSLLEEEIKAIPGEPGTPAYNEELQKLYSGYVQSAAPMVASKLEEQAGKLSEQISAMRESINTNLANLANRYLDQGGYLKDLPLQTWQKLAGKDGLPGASDAVYKNGGQVYVKRAYAWDEIASRYGFASDTEFESALGKARAQQQQLRGMQSDLADLRGDQQTINGMFQEAVPEGGQGALAGMPSAENANGGPQPGQAQGTLAKQAEKMLQGAQGTAEQQGSLRPPDEGDAANILLKKFPAAVQPYIQSVADTYGQFAGQRRGVITDVQARKNAAEAALGMSVEQFLRTKPGQAFNQEQVIALGETMAKYGNDLDTLSKAAQEARLNGTLTLSQEAQLADKALEFAALSAVRSGATAEAGRALRAFRAVMSGDQEFTARAFAKAAKKFGVNPEDLRKQTAPETPPSSGGTTGPVPPNFRPPGESPTGSRPDLFGQKAPESGIPPNPNLGNAAQQGELIPPKFGAPAESAPVDLQGHNYQPGLLPEQTREMPDLVPVGAEQAANARQGEIPAGPSTPGPDFQKTAEAAFNQLGGRQKFEDWIRAWSLTPATDVAGRYRLLQALYTPSLMDKALAFGISNMLSSTKTGEIIGMHGAVMALNRPLLTLIRANPADALANVVGQTRAIGTAWANAVEALKTGVGPSTAAAQLRTGNLEVRPEAFAGTSGLIATPTLRVINALHEFFRTTATAGAMAEFARQESLATGRTIDDLLANPTQKMIEGADAAADQALHGGDPSAVAQLILNARGMAHTDLSGANFNAKNVGKVATGLTANLLLPFVRIPDYLYRNGLKLTFAPAYYGATTATHLLRGENAQALSDARMWGVTSLLWAGILGEAVAGNVTGSGPATPEKRALLEQARDPATGQPVWQAHSTRVPLPGGGYRWVDNNAFGPLALPLNALASAVESYRLEGIKPTAQPSDFLMNVASDTAKSMLDASYIRTAGQFFSSLMQGQGAKHAGVQLAGNIAGRFVPGESLAAEVARTVDSGTKAPENTVQQIAGRIPGVSQSVPNQVGPYGQPIQNRQDLLSTLSPAITSTAGTVNPAANEVARLQQAGFPVSVRAIPASQQEQGGTFQGAQQTGAQMRALQQGLGQNAQRYLSAAMAQPGYAQLSDKQKAATLNAALNLAYTQAQKTGGLGQTMDAPHQAAAAWDAVPKYVGVKGSADQVRAQNFAIEQARAKLAEYRKKYGADLGEYRLMKEDKTAFALAQRPTIDADYLKMVHARIDKQYQGALTRADQQGLTGVGHTVVSDQTAVGAGP